jgi:hypothetical protein
LKAERKQLKVGILLLSRTAVTLGCCEEGPRPLGNVAAWLLLPRPLRPCDGGAWAQLTGLLPSVTESFSLSGVSFLIPSPIKS